MERREHLVRSQLPSRSLSAARRRAVQRGCHVPQPSAGGVGGARRQARDGPYLSCARRRAPGAYRRGAGPHAETLLRRVGMAVRLEGRELPRCLPLDQGPAMTQELGRLEDLPWDYREALIKQNLVPLWPNLRSVLPPRKPQPKTKPACWSYQALRPLLLKAGELTPVEKAERRVLVLANPGHGLENMQASAAIYLGMQLLLPGGWATSHSHSPNAVRVIVEGESAYTTVNGEKCTMRRGDLILTPSWQWHEHGHEGDKPVVWLDVLDLPLVYYLEASYAVEGIRQTVKPDRGDLVYAHGGILPTVDFQR